MAGFWPYRELPVTYSDLFLQAVANWSAQPSFWLIGGLCVFLIAFSKGAFGGGAASIGVPMMSLFVDPLGAAIIVAPLVSLMDMFTLRAFGPADWSKPDLAALLPGLFIGIGLGWLMFTLVDPHLVGIAIGATSIAFALHWFWQRWQKKQPAAMPVKPLAGLVAGAASGFTTFIAHAGGPPVAIYLIRRGLDKRFFVGTNTAIFTIGNLIKLGPYGFLLAARPDAAAAAVLLAPIIPFSVLFGVRVHNLLSQTMILVLTNIVMILGGLRLLYTGFH